MINNKYVINKKNKTNTKNIIIFICLITSCKFKYNILKIN